ncbi:hypothetical protein CEUSTIGMA_g675.t1 [Chlamydomonas eustigma]|uniref:Uncharacterized protein n=1 Tax=Chlamydomonas eustigma TaxID=1157962 RepID=A0A250WRC4_9CHLO|nr:hypothetical protein CEUSTIGMA_g675.t1 [Chlamydomonas eustigma]|eukprot:GAX73222.1 hypothetical protein CEUSTIGMA_g675.t1 [Chlamydomonas eustigma]
MADTSKNRFLIKTSENELLNQYWYSAATIEALVQEILSSASRVAFLSTPSVYFSLPKDSEVKKSSWVFDFDEQWRTDPHFCKYDFNKPEDLPGNLLNDFDMVVIDPPFITREVWEKYTKAAKLLLKNEGKVIASTVAENDGLLSELLGSKPCNFKPSIPHLIYQYNFFTNYKPTALAEKNPEIPEDD